MIQFSSRLGYSTVPTSYVYKLYSYSVLPGYALVQYGVQYETGSRGLWVHDKK
jgi:hypothetical protein